MVHNRFVVLAEEDGEDHTISSGANRTQRVWLIHNTKEVELKAIPVNQFGESSVHSQFDVVDLTEEQTTRIMRGALDHISSGRSQ